MIGYNLIRDMIFDYQQPAFDLGIDGGNRPASPKYEPPRDAAPGFTRTPGEDEVVVCPNCGDELATGHNEMKQELWVIKVCGHVSLPEGGRENYFCANADLEPSRCIAGPAREAESKHRSPPGQRAKEKPGLPTIWPIFPH
jgi:hypothetical protein